MHGVSFAQQAGTQMSTDFEQPVHLSTKQTVTLTLQGAGAQQGAGAGAHGAGAPHVGSGAQQVGSGAQQVGSGAQQSLRWNRPASAIDVQHANTVATQSAANELRNIGEISKRLS